MRLFIHIGAPVLCFLGTVLALYGAALGLTQFLGRDFIRLALTTWWLITTLRFAKALTWLEVFMRARPVNGGRGPRNTGVALMALYMSAVGIILNLIGNVLWILDSTLWS
jgi:hypothetical protein